MPILHQKHFLTHSPIEVGWGLAEETPTIQQVVSRITQQPLEKKEGEEESKYVCVFLGHTIHFPFQPLFSFSTPLHTFSLFATH